MFPTPDRPHSTSRPFRPAVEFVTVIVHAPYASSAVIRTAPLLEKLSWSSVTVALPLLPPVTHHDENVVHDIVSAAPEYATLIPLIVLEGASKVTVAMAFVFWVLIAPKTVMLPPRTSTGPLPASMVSDAPEAM